MPKLQCVSCGGVYDPLCADGLPYYHACPPLTKLRVLNVDGTYSTVDPGQEGVRRVVGVKFEPRPDARNENAKLNPVTGKSDVIAAGKGTAPIADNAIP